MALHQQGGQEKNQLTFFIIVQKNMLRIFLLPGLGSPGLIGFLHRFVRPFLVCAGHRDLRLMGVLLQKDDEDDVLFTEAELSHALANGRATAPRDDIPIFCNYSSASLAIPFFGFITFDIVIDTCHPSEPAASLSPSLRSLRIFIDLSPSRLVSVR